MVDYPGLSVFSSNLENSTKNLFDRLGNNGLMLLLIIKERTFPRCSILCEIFSSSKTCIYEEYPDTSKMYVFGNMVN